MARKIPDGEFRNKERTKQKLIETVGEVIRSEGYSKLGVNNIANKAGVSKKLIYRYFTTVDNLIETYIKQKDYWVTLNSEVGELMTANKHNHGKALAGSFLENLFNHLQTLPETQKIILWEISEKSKLMREVSLIREALGSHLFKITDPEFANTDIDIRAVYALLIGGIYYLNLHANGTGGTFCEIDIKTAEGKERIIKGLKTIVDLCYQEADKQNEAPRNTQPKKRSVHRKGEFQ